VAREFLAWLAPSPGLAWADVGCGTGALAHTILSLATPRLVLALDRSFAFVSATRAQARAWPASSRFAVADAAALPLADACCDFAVSGLVINFVPKPAAMIAELLRTLGRRGRLALYVWDYAERMELMRYFWDAAAELDPAAGELDEGRRFPLCRPEPLRQLLERCGAGDVEVRAIDVPTTFRDFAGFWSPFLGGQGPAPGYVAGLGEAERAALRELLRARVPRRANGSIALVARAWAVRGRAP
jgi:SAM-dependent methyltransferase